jgi:hypothetical protein
MTVTFDEIIQRYNKINNTNINCLYTDTLDLESVIDSLFDNNGFEINEDTETIELF